MTASIPIPNPAEDLIRIHKVITRGIKVGITHGTDYIKNGFPQSKLLLGYTTYTLSLGSVLRAHHLGEDQVAFPALRIKLPSAPYDLLTANHREMESLLVIIRQAIDAVSGDLSEDGMRVLVENLSKLWAIWKKHIFWEELHFSKDAVNVVMDLEEQGRLSEAMNKHSQEHSEPPYWVVPFILFNLKLEDRVSMAATFPPMILEELVPKVWKERWEPMKPFLLD
jgi:hypothetical protein